MERNQMKKILKALGMSEKLLEMPAVMERIYQVLKDKTEEEMVKEIVNVSNDGKTVRIDKLGLFQELENGGAKYGSGVIIDKYGMDLSYSEDNMFLPSINMKRTEDRKIKITTTNDSTIEINENTFNDDGDAILNYQNYTILKKGATPTLGWEGNKEFLTNFYPITKEWFAQRENDIEKDEGSKEDVSEIETRSEEQKQEEVIEQLNQEIQIQKELIKSLSSKSDKLIQENIQLKNKNSKLQTMLNRTLELCETVQKSKFGKFFFRKQLKALPDIQEDNER